MIKIIKKYRFLICIVLILVCLTTIFYGIVESSSSSLNGFKIVVDAGHGGRDGGSIGVEGTIEKEINLKYALALKDRLCENGFIVELTRRNDDGLYSLTDKNKKLADMKERLRIIKRTNPNLVVSIHMNSFTSSTARGAMVYYRKNDMSGKLCADLIQKSFHTYCDARFEEAKVGDYYMLNSSYYTAVLIECGFLSNREEEFLLNTEDYKTKIVDAIYKGILLYFGKGFA